MAGVELFLWMMFVTLTRVDVGCLDQSVYKLAEGYNKKDPPNLFSTDTADKPLILTVEIKILDILKVVESENEVSMDLVLWRTWFEPRLEFIHPPPEGTRHSVMEDEIDAFWIPKDAYVMGMREFGNGQDVQNMRFLMLSRDKMMYLLTRSNLIMRCKFDFQFYPLDTQVCKLDFTSLRRPVEVQIHQWKNSTPVGFRGNVMEIQGPEFQASLVYCKEPLILNNIAGNASALRIWLTLKRDLKPYLIESYAPTALFVFVSWGSFLVKPEVVPGRMVLLVTTLLSLVTLFEATRNEGPPAGSITCIDVWLLCCILFVFLALLEYATILMRIRGHFCATYENKVHGVQVLCQVSNGRLHQHAPEKSLRCRSQCKLMFRRFLTTFYQDSTGFLMDKFALLFFPFMFVVYNLVYWRTFLNNDKIVKECTVNNET